MAWSRRSSPQLVSDDPTGLAERIERLHTDSAANDEASLEGARLAAHHFSEEHSLDRLREILQTPSTNKVANDQRSNSTKNMTAIA